MFGWQDNHLGRKVDIYSQLVVPKKKKIPDLLKMLECKIQNCKGTRGKSTLSSLSW